MWCQSKMENLSRRIHKSFPSSLRRFCSRVITKPFVALHACTLLVPGYMRVSRFATFIDDQQLEFLHKNMQQSKQAPLLAETNEFIGPTTCAFLFHILRVFLLTKNAFLYAFPFFKKCLRRAKSESEYTLTLEWLSILLLVSVLYPLVKMHL